MDLNIFELASREYGISPLPDNPQVAMAYVPYQTDNSLYTTDQGLESGTMFPVLNKPFLGCKEMKK